MDCTALSIMPALRSRDCSFRENISFSSEAFDALIHRMLSTTTGTAIRASIMPKYFHSRRLNQ